MTMNPRQRVQWEQTRQKGRWRFILLYAAYMSSFVFLFTSLANHFLLGHPVWEDLGFRIPVLIVMGLLLGWMMWEMNESMYKRSSPSS
jgi:hypothetical protein